MLMLLFFRVFDISRKKKCFIVLFFIFSSTGKLINTNIQMFLTCSVFSRRQNKKDLLLLLTFEQHFNTENILFIILSLNHLMLLMSSVKMSMCKQEDWNSDYAPTKLTTAAICGKEGIKEINQVHIQHLNLHFRHSL